MAIPISLVVLIHQKTTLPLWVVERKIAFVEYGVSSNTKHLLNDTERRGEDSSTLPMRK